MTESTYRLPIMETIKTAWDKVSGAKGSIWAVIGIFFLVQIVLGICGSIGAKGFFNFLGSIVQIIASASVIYLGIRRAQDSTLSYNMIKDILTVRIILCIIGTYLLQLLILLPAGIVAGLGGYLLQSFTGASMHLLGGILCLVATLLFIFLSVRMWLGFGAVLDKKLNPWDAIVLSFKGTKDNVLNLIGIMLINILIAIVCGITLGIGFIWGLPWLLIIYGESYKRLSTRQDMRFVG